MKVKERVLEALERNREKDVSGAELAAELGVSRNAVWKAITSLREEGHNIIAATNRGYRLDAQSRVLTAQSVRRYIGDGYPFDIEVRESVPSTNTVLRDCAAASGREGAVLVAVTQTEGRGRQGRAFRCAPGSGCYFSLLLRPGYHAEITAYITTVAALAVAEAIEAVTGDRALIKWVNDVFVSGKKVCGILTEAALDMESGGIDYAVLGIGINVRAPEGGFPKELEGIAGTVTDPGDGTDIISALIGETLCRFWDYYKKLDMRAFLKAYRERSLILGREITVLYPDGGRNARALEIDDACGLVVEFENGERATLSSGEVSVRPNGGAENAH